MVFCMVIIHMNEELTFDNAILVDLLWNYAAKKYNKYEYFKRGKEIKRQVYSVKMEQKFKRVGSYMVNQSISR